jgi:TetR/AcrR family transcriptional repressor for divergent bdcA
VVHTKLSRARGRPRLFDPDEAVATAQRLFHSRGYDAVSIAHLTQAIGINPPSFYAAFGSKAELYSRILDRYAGTGAIPLFDLLNADRPVAECLVAVLEAAARRYAADPDAAGCLVIEGVRCTDREAREAAGTFLAAAEEAIHRFVAARHPDQAERVTDYMSTVMAGLSASARNGHDLDRLLAAARLAGAGLEQVVRG